ncbi:MAG: hypothetical protein RL357_892 [Pseudomonadota bacterium]
MNAPLPHIAAPPWGQTYRNAHPAFGLPVEPSPVPQPSWVFRNQRLAEELALPDPWWTSEAALSLLSGNGTDPGNLPHACVYSGHQFGHWAGQLGDGRALLLGDWRTGASRQEIQLKGAGPTPYSRMGDGRAVLRSSLREYWASEAMHALGVPTTRALALVQSPLPVRRERVETAAILTRTAPSFIRFGHFEHFAHHGMPDALTALIEHVCTDVWADIGQAHQGDERVAALLQRAVTRSADLVAAWQCMGFCHGVLNTDNMSLLGITLDYGPFQWMDAHVPDHICNHSDTFGRYAFDQQPSIVYWNLQALAVALRPAVASESVLVQALSAFGPRYAEAWRAGMANKLAMSQAQGHEDQRTELIRGWVGLLASQRADHTRAHRRLAEVLSRAPSWNALERTPLALQQEFGQSPDFDAWWRDARALWQQLADHPQTLGAPLLRTNPKYVLRNHMAQEAIDAAERGDLRPAQRLLEVITQPFDEHPSHESWAYDVPSWAQTLAVSCSS